MTGALPMIHSLRHAFVLIASLAGAAAPLGCGRPFVPATPPGFVDLGDRYGDDEYRRLRPTIAVPAPRGGSREAALDLDGHFGLHPALEPLLPLWRERSLAVVHAVGSPDPTRSHFDAQDFMESGTPGRKGTDDGWLNRHLRSARPAAAAEDQAQDVTHRFHSISWSQEQPLNLPQDIVKRNGWIGEDENHASRIEDTMTLWQLLGLPYHEFVEWFVIVLLLLYFVPLAVGVPWVLMTKSNSTSATAWCRRSRR